MTLANSKKLLEHYLKTGNEEAAKDMKENILRKEEKIKKSK